MKEIYEVYTNYDYHCTEKLFESQELAEKYIELSHNAGLRWRKISVEDSLPALPKWYSEGYSTYSVDCCPNTGSISCEANNWFAKLWSKIDKNEAFNITFYMKVFAKNETKATEEIRSDVKEYLKSHPKMKNAIAKNFRCIDFSKK